MASRASVDYQWSSSGAGSPHAGHGPFRTHPDARCDAWAVGAASPRAPFFVTADTNGVRLHVVDAGVFRSQVVNSLSASQPMLVSTVQSSTRAVIVNGSVSRRCRVGVECLRRLFDAGLPLGLAVHDTHRAPCWLRTTALQPFVASTWRLEDNQARA